MWIILLCFFVSTSALFFGIYEFFRERRIHRKTAHIPGPLTFPIIGSAYILLGSPEYVLKHIIELHKFYGSPVKIVFGPKVWIGIANPEQIKIVLRSKATIEKDSVYNNILKKYAGNGLLFSENKVWSLHRKLLQPTLTGHILHSFTEIIQNNSVLLTRAVEAHVGCAEFELSPHILKTMFFNTLEIVAGVSQETENKNNLEAYLYNIHRTMALIFERAQRLWMHVDIALLFSKLGRDLKKCETRLNKFTNTIIQQKRGSMKINTHNRDEETFGKKCIPPLELMIHLADNENKFSDKDLRDHILTFIIGSYDTSTRILNFMLLMLASHSEIQDQVYDEIFNIYGDKDVENNPVQFEDLQKLKYLERVIKETLRLFPVAPVIARRASDDLDLDGCFIPKGCGIGINILALHRDENIWPDPLKFDPDRFLPEAMSQRHPCDYIPFSYGTRDCIGRMYAMMSLKIIAATFLRKYVVKKDIILPVKDIRLEADLLLKPVEAIKMRIEKRINKDHHSRSYS